MGRKEKEPICAICARLGKMTKAHGTITMRDGNGNALSEIWVCEAHCNDYRRSNLARRKFMYDKAVAWVRKIHSDASVDNALKKIKAGSVG